MHKGALEASLAFGSGVHHMLRGIMEYFSVPEEVARSYMDLIDSGKGDPEFVRNLEEVVLKSGEAWSVEYEKCIVSLQGNKQRPRTYFLITKKGMNPAFSKLLKAIDAEHTIILLDNQNLFEHVHSAGGVTDAEFLLLEALFLEYHDYPLK
jgi:hypothetical protein